MRSTLRFIFASALVLAASFAAAAEIKPFVREDAASDVVRLAETLRKETADNGAKLKGMGADDLDKSAAAAEKKGDYKWASVLLGARVAADPKAFASWLALAKLGAAADDA